MGVLDNDRVWNCTVRIYDLHFGNPTSTDSITAQNTSTYTNDNIKSWKITDTMSANGDVAFGSTGSKALSLELFGLSSKSFGTGAIIDITLGGAAIKTWVFFVDTVAWNTEYGTTTKYTASVQAYDAMYYASSKISGLASNASTPPAIQTILASGTADMTQCKTLAQYCIRHSRYDLIRARASELSETTGDKYDIYANMYDSRDDDGWSSGNTMDDVCADSTGKIQIGDITGFTGNISISNAITGRTLLGRMAALNGLRAYCDNYAVNKVGTINFTSLMGAYYNAITTADVYDNGFVSEGKKKYQYFTNGKVTYGKKTSNGFSTMSIDCPDMTQTKINALGNNFKNTEYEIGTVKFRGDPNLTSGMRLYAPDATGTTHDIVCTKVVTNYDGGLYQQIYSEGKSDSDIEFENNAYAENAEEVVDEGGGGGGGGTSLLYYHETTSPNTAEINVGSNYINVNSTNISFVGNIDVGGNTAITGDLSVTGDINCSGSLTYASLSVGSLDVSGRSYFGDDLHISDNTIQMEKTVTIGGVVGTMYSSLDTAEYFGHDILLASLRAGEYSGTPYRANNRAVLYTFNPDIPYQGQVINEGWYGRPPQLRFSQERERNGVQQLTPTAVYSLDGITLAPSERVVTSGGQNYVDTCGGISITLTSLSSTTSALRIAFYNTTTNATLGSYTITQANIAALANLQ